MTMGAHQVANAVAATAAALAALAMNDDIDDQSVTRIAEALSNAVSRSAMRMQLRERADGWCWSRTATTPTLTRWPHR
ncbi:UDP-N-acetylmuramoylalanyl-D-glutamyl-2,6-diaminopimelate-D-alanyl-D-alanine ligase [Cutibacterium acnes JCM 18909]|nr:UDP-N-acetylmuramoylalanyl-D-glutamyl-2,6-diaminopimelate-D-alanyl-D-alanine ligase [Cutibacterium acnes JCM 18909]